MVLIISQIHLLFNGMVGLKCLEVEAKKPLVYEPYIGHKVEGYVF